MSRITARIGDRISVIAGTADYEILTARGWVVVETFGCSALLEYVGGN